MNLEAFLSPTDAARIAWERVHPEPVGQRPGPRSSLQVLLDLARSRRNHPDRAA